MTSPSPPPRMRTLLLLALIMLCCAPALAEAMHAQSPEHEYVLDSTLQLLRTLRTQVNPPPRLRSLLDSPKVDTSVRFRGGWLLSAPNLALMERELDIEFTRVNGRIARVGKICGAQVPWDALDRLASWPGVARVDSIWKPAMATALDVSTREIRADDVWELLDAGGWPVTGRGIVIADFDTGIDVFHPDFWRADGGTYHWLDTNANGAFDPSIDAVDLNRNGSAEANELLDFVNSTSSQSDAVPGADDGVFYPRMDWFYNDADGNGQRDYGLPSGFVEQDPTYGERLFLLNDSNDNRIVDMGEVLLALGTCKVQKTRDASGVERTRDINLIYNPPDVNGHGTHVGSILCGGSVGLRRYVGVAPDSKLLLAQFLDSQGNNAYTSYIPWAEDNGAHIMLYEFGSWVQEFMDGSSNLEQMLDAESAKGIVQIAVAGNLAGGQKHAHLILSTAYAHDVRFMVPYGEEIADAWLSILWPAALDAVSVQIVTPWGTPVTLPGNNTMINVDGHSIWSYREHSNQGTARFDILVYRGGSTLAEGDWTLRLRNQTPYGLNVNAYVSDGDARWTGGVIFLDQIDDMYTVTSPGTADSAITVASYSTRGREGDGRGALSPFSGQGPRIDGERVLDLAAPGHYTDIACASSKDVPGGQLGQYGWFGGTSAAAPHVAAAVALLLQQNPGTRPEQVKQMLHDSAAQDAHTGLVPNFRWGWGKLDIGTALSAPRKPTPTPRAQTFLPIILRLTYP